MFTILYLASICAAAVSGGPSTETYKDQYCTDPRTMKKHPAYTEWADAYSCTRHRCQPGGRNLAIYTVGCKRVEAPESAIECEEVVEDTNMQFPYCCTRLRCLVVVRGEVWTRVLGQPWETLPAAPWSHMYKMKKPPPVDNTFLPKAKGEGPVYELAAEPEAVPVDTTSEKVLRAMQKKEDCDNPAPSLRAQPAAPAPDIVIALSTSSDDKDAHKKPENVSRHKRGRKSATTLAVPVETEPLEIEETSPPEKENLKVEAPAVGPVSEERIFTVTQKDIAKGRPWAEVPATAWGAPANTGNAAPGEDARVGLSFRTHSAPAHSVVSNDISETSHSADFQQPETEVKEPGEKPAALQALVDAIGNRMKDIESVVQRMSEKVHQNKPAPQDTRDQHGQHDQRDQHGQHDQRDQHDTRDLRDAPEATEKALLEAEVPSPKPMHVKHHSKQQLQPQSPLEPQEDQDSPAGIKPKRPSPDAEHYTRFSVRNRGSKYLHTSPEATTEAPLYAEETGGNNAGYYSDASNSVLRRSNSPKLHKLNDLTQMNEQNGNFVDVTETFVKSYPKEPATYMAPVVEVRRKLHTDSEGETEGEKKHKKHMHKKKHARNKSHKKHKSHDEKKRKIRPSSTEIERNVVSLEDSSAGNN